MEDKQEVFEVLHFSSSCGVANFCSSNKFWVALIQNFRLLILPCVFLDILSPDIGDGVV